VYSVHSIPLSTPDPDEAKAYDNFTLTQTFIVNGVQWSGIYAEPIPSPGATVDFLVEFWSDQSGAPDVSGPIHQFYLLHGPAGDASALPNPNGDVTRSVPITGAHVSPLTSTTPGGGPAVSYSAALADTTLAAGDYWISIQAVQAFNSPLAVDPEWQWHLGSGPGDGFYAADLTLDPNSGIQGVFHAEKDLAFALEGRVVPEPASLLVWLLGSASCALGAVLRRRRK
jgi:hypothetical protein